MDSELSRLRSFQVWPKNVPMCTRTLSAKGFYATGNLYEVECNWCHCRFSDWELDENIERRHIRANPNCEFIVNRLQCGNIALPVLSSALIQPQNQHQVRTSKEGSTKLDMLTEKDRLVTFANWPNPHISPQSLAKAGFFYRNQSDEVECAWCKGVIAQWEKQDNAFDEHRRFFPECPRVQLGPLIEIVNDGIRDLGVQQISPPKNPRYSSLQARMRTYSNWPISDIQRPEDLAEAGLYYQKVDDQVRCFHCNMGLRSWEKEDDPWFEHAKWYSMCQFVRLVKGVNYIQEVQELTRTAKMSCNPVVNITIEEAMLMEPVKLALDMGIAEDTLRNKIQQRIIETGCTYETLDDLIKSVFDEQEDITSDFENIPQITSNSRQPIGFNTGDDINLNDRATLQHEVNITCFSTSTKGSSICKTNVNKSFENPNAKIRANEIANASSSFESKRKLTSYRKDLEEENRKLKDARLCKVCLDEEVGVVYLPCGHLVTCVQCAPGVNQCPMCRTKIKGFVRTYLS